MKNKYLSNVNLILFIYLAFTLTLVLIYGFDLSQFVQFSNLTDLSRIPFEINPKDQTGYDGQFYVRLALNPFELDWAHKNLPENNPSYRYSRIGYPLLLWSVSFFIKNQIIIIAQLLNFILIIMIYFVNRNILKFLNKDTSLAIIFAFFPGYLFCIARVTPEILEVLLLSLAVYFYLRDRLMLFLIVSCFALLTRETSIIFFISMFIYQIVFSKKNYKYSLFPILFYFIWIVILYLLFNNIPIGTGVSVNFNSPLSGILEIFRINRYSGNVLQGFTYILEYLHIFLLISLVFYKKKFFEDNIFKFAFFIYFLFFLTLHEVVLGTDWGFMRILLELYYFLILFLITDGGKKIFIVKLLNTSLFIFCFLRIVFEQYLTYNL